jgi:hypothetical protein
MISDPIVRVALDVVSHNKETGLLHPSDKSSAVNAFRLLRDKGHRYSPVEIKQWALENGWSPQHAGELADVARKIQEGRALRAPPKWTPELRRWFYANWQERAK